MENRPLRPRSKCTQKHCLINLYTFSIEINLNTCYFWNSRCRFFLIFELCKFGFIWPLDMYKQKTFIVHQQMGSKILANLREDSFANRGDSDSNRTTGRLHPGIMYLDVLTCSSFSFSSFFSPLLALRTLKIRFKWLPDENTVWLYISHFTIYMFTKSGIWLLVDKNYIWYKKTSITFQVSTNTF